MGVDEEDITGTSQSFKLPKKQEVVIAIAIAAAGEGTYSQYLHHPT